MLTSTKIRGLGIKGIFYEKFHFQGRHIKIIKGNNWILSHNQILFMMLYKKLVYEGYMSVKLRTKFQVSCIILVSTAKSPSRLGLKRKIDDCVKTLIPHLTLENSAVITTLMNFLNFTLRLKAFSLHSSPQQYYLLHVGKLWIWSVRKGHFNRILKNH